MYDRQTSFASLRLYFEARKLVCSAFPLKRQVLECQRELNALTSNYTTADLKRISDLRDEIFGFESLEGYTRVGSQHKAAFVQA